MKKMILMALATGIVSMGQAQLLDKIKNKVNKAADEVNRTVNRASSTGSSTGSASGSSTSTGNGSYQSSSIPADIVISNTPGGSPVKQFTTGDNIYAHIKLKTSIADYLDQQALDEPEYFHLPVNLRGDQSGHSEFCNIRIPKAKFKQTEFDIDILPADGKNLAQYFIGDDIKTHLAMPLTYFSDYPEASDFVKINYTLTVGLQGDKHEGNFAFTVVNPKDLKALKQRVEKIRDNMDVAVASDTKLPEAFSKASAKNADPALSVANMKAMIQKPGMTIIKAVVGQGDVDYDVVTNELGVPKFKINHRQFWVAYKFNGQCYYTRFSFLRNYEGGGKYGQLQVAATTASNVMIACENIK